MDILLVCRSHVWSPLARSYKCGASVQVQDEAASIAEYCGGLIKVAQLTATMNAAAQVSASMYHHYILAGLQRSILGFKSMGRPLKTTSEPLYGGASPETRAGVIYSASDASGFGAKATQSRV